MRILVPLAMFLALCASSTRAGEETPRCGGLGPDAIARLILEDDGPEQVLVAQAMRSAGRDTLARVHQAIRRLAPQVEKEKAARGPEPELREVGDALLHLVTVEMRLLETDPAFRRDVGVDTGGPRRSAPGTKAEGTSSITFLDDLQLEVILRAVEKSERITQITAPRLTVYDRQRANVSVLNQRSFVADVEPLDRGNGVVEARPVVETAQEGIVLGLRPTLSEDRRYVTLELSLLTAELVAPPSPKSIVCAGKTIPLTLPTTRLQQTRSTVCIPSGGTVLIDQGIQPGGRVRLALVTARHLELTARELREAGGEVPGGDKGKPAGK